MISPIIVIGHWHMIYVEASGHGDKYQLSFATL